VLSTAVIPTVSFSFDSTQLPSSTSGNCLVQSSFLCNFLITVGSVLHENFQARSVEDLKPLHVLNAVHFGGA
jgi:hypothetical protein